MTKPQVTITVSGPTGSGKTTVATLIADELEQHFAVTHSINPQEAKQARTTRAAVLASAGLELTIVEQQTRRGLPAACMTLTEVLEGAELLVHSPANLERMITAQRDQHRVLIERAISVLQTQLERLDRVDALEGRAGTATAVKMVAWMYLASVLLRNMGKPVSLGSFYSQHDVDAACAFLASCGYRARRTDGEPSAGGWIELIAERIEP